MKHPSNQIAEQKRFSRWNVGKMSLRQSPLNTVLTLSKLRYQVDDVSLPHQSLTEASFEYTRHYCLSELLPYDMRVKTGAGLRTALKEYDMLLVAGLEALDTLRAGIFEKFDALVGENACEIRAVWFSVIVANDLVDSTKLRQELYSTRKCINELLQEKTLSLLMRSGISLMKLFKKENLSVFLRLEELFIIQAFLLTEAKELLSNANGAISLCLKEKSNAKKIRRFGDISSSFAENLLSRIRKLIAAASVQFVRQMAVRAKSKSLVHMLSEPFTLLHNNHLLCTPMFWTYKSMLSAAHYEGIPLLVYAEFLEQDGADYKVIDSDWLFFEPTFNAEGAAVFVCKQPKELDYTKIACVVQGGVVLDKTEPNFRSQWKKKMLEFPITTIILAGAADHRQYPRIEDDVKIQSVQDHEYEFYKTFAKSHGFSIDNPRTFFIRHVYPSHIGAICSSNKSRGVQLAHS